MVLGVLRLEKTSYQTEESSKRLSVGVVREDGTEGDITVEWKAIDQTATYGQDFTTRDGTIEFGAGEVIYTSPINILHQVIFTCVSLY